MLTFDYPFWFLGFCLLTGAAYTLLLYYRERTFAEVNIWWRRLMWALRFTAVSILAFLLLSPLLRTYQTDTKKPIIAIVTDNSASVPMGMRTTDTLAFAKGMKELAQTLGEAYDVKTYTFGDKVREGLSFSYTDKITNISDALGEIYDTYTNQNLGAVVLATDGIYNQGSNPLYMGQKLAVPIYTVALGDTVPKKDVLIKRLYHNQIAYLGDKFTVQIDVAAHHCQGSNTTLTIAKGNNTTTKNIAINADDFFSTIEIPLSADAVGVQRYRVSLSAVTGEATTANNTKEMIIEVIDARQKVLILANAPHPDLAALKQAVSDNKNYEVEIQYINEFKGDAGKYDLIVLHELPGSNGDARTVLAQAARKPKWFILGNQTNLAAFSQAQTVLRVSGSVANTNEVQAAAAPNFQQFTLNPAFAAELGKLPPMIAPFGEYTADPTAHTLFQQKIGAVATKYPLWVFGEKENIKTAVLAAEGLWRWRLQDFILHKNFVATNELITQTVQYLTVKDDKRKFRAFSNKTIYDENESITLDAELYNDAYQRINDPDAKLIITDEKGKEYPFTFTRTSNYYTLNAGLLPVGDYSFKATTTHSGANLSAAGSFTVKPIQLEIFETTADHRLLRTLSAQFEGATVAPTQIAQIAALIKAKSTVKPVLYASLRTRSLIELKWLCALILGLLFGEWFLRKRNGLP